MKMLDGMEQLTLQVSYLFPFKSYLKDFPVSKYTCVPCVKVAMLCAFALCGLIVIMVHWAIAYSEPNLETSKMKLFAKIVISKEVTTLLRCLKGFRIRLC